MPKQVHSKIKYCDFGGYYYYDQKKKTWFYEYKKTEKGIVSCRKRLRAKSETLLKKKIHEFQLQLNDPNYGKPIQTIKKIADDWMKAEVINKVAQNTVRDYTRNISFINEYLGDKDIVDVELDDIEQFQATLDASAGAKSTGLSPRSINAVIATLNRIFVYAIKHKYVTYNPTACIKPVKRNQTDKVILSADEVKNLLTVAKEGAFIYKEIRGKEMTSKPEPVQYNIKMHYTLMVLAFATGMRIGELRGLRISDILLDENKIKVAVQFQSQCGGKIYSKEEVDKLKLIAATTKSINDIRAADNANPFKELKTANSKRIVDIPAETMAIIKEFIEYQKEYAKRHNEFNNEWGFLFANSSGGPIDDSALRHRYFSKLKQECNIDENFTLHSIRHTHASLLILNKVPINIVSRRLGHVDPSVTLKVYAHVLPTSDGIASNAWGKIVA